MTMRVVMILAIHLESELMENQDEEEVDDFMEEIDLKEAEDRTDLAEPQEEAEYWEVLRRRFIQIIHHVANTFDTNGRRSSTET